MFLRIIVPERLTSAIVETAISYFIEPIAFNKKRGAGESLFMIDVKASKIKVTRLRQAIVSSDYYDWRDITFKTAPSSSPCLTPNDEGHL